jgi:1-deoxy-D-xylulose-5-phosphate reductoisomerase
VRKIAILGATGSIGQSALAVVDAHRDRLRVVALAAGENVAKCGDQISRFKPDLVGMASATALADLQAELKRTGTPIPNAVCGPDALVAVATHPEADLVLFASSGTAALDAVLAAIDAGKIVALANKEILVMAGSLVMERAKRRNVPVLPVDSEHNAIHQCLDGRPREHIKRLVLTASGGPFRGLSAAELARVTPEDALRHPTWRMGPKITIDSATLMNKGLEVIEARWLFDVGAGRIDVLVHPQSIVHSLVEFVDGSLLAQLGVTDMRLPIQYAFSYPERWNAALPSLDLAKSGRLEFEEPDVERFPGLALAFRALAGDPGLPIVLNAANEVAVAAFLNGRLPFTAITDVIRDCMDTYEGEGRRPIETLSDVRSVDSRARAQAAESAGRVQSKVQL